ncbi:hypothetical protein ACP70R_045509 [Stipagrostis hirtigluma subsp. patula]
MASRRSVEQWKFLERESGRARVAGGSNANHCCSEFSQHFPCLASDTNPWAMASWQQWIVNGNNADARWELGSKEIFRGCLTDNMDTLADRLNSEDANLVTGTRVPYSVCSHCFYDFIRTGSIDSDVQAQSFYCNGAIQWPREQLKVDRSDGCGKEYVGSVIQKRWLSQLFFA